MFLKRTLYCYVPKRSKCDHESSMSELQGSWFIPLTHGVRACLPEKSLKAYNLTEKIVKISYSTEIAWATFLNFTSIPLNSIISKL